MPQLIPFYFINQLTFAFTILFILIFIFSKYILPSNTFIQVTRLYITKLSNKNKSTPSQLYLAKNSKFYYSNLKLKFINKFKNYYSTFKSKTIYLDP